MGQRLILDSTALIDYGRGKALPGDDDDDVAVAAVSVAEYRRGIVSATDPNLRQKRQQAFDRLFGKAGETALVAVLPYTADTAEHYAVLLAHTATTGRPRGAHDLIIAAHARESGRHLVSSDASAKFGDLPEVLVLGADTV